MSETREVVAPSDVERVARSANRWTWISRILFALLALAVIGYAVFSSLASAATRDELGDVKDRLAQSESQGQALSDQIIALGETPVVTPSTSTSDPIIITPTNGQDGEDAPPPTDAQVYAAVVQCFTTGACVAPKPDPGQDGKDGQDAPAPTFEQMMAAVQQCFASGLCVAPAGGQGPAGPTCPEGFTATAVWLSASDSELEIPTQRQAIVCLPTPIEGEPTP